MSVSLNSFKPTDDGTYVYTVPFSPSNTKMPACAPAEDAGLFIAAILLHGKDTLGKRVLGASGWISADEMVKGFSEVTGHKAKSNQITFKQFHDFMPPAAADELTGNFQLIEDPGYFVGEPADALDKSIELVTSAGLRKPTSWNDFVKKHFKAQ
jgi:NmrA-like family